jgi:tight adherence protein C
MFFRFVMPFIVFAAALFYLFLITHFTWSPLMKLLAAFGAALFGFFLPDLFVSNASRSASNRSCAVSRRARPDADLRGVGHVDRSRVHARGVGDRPAIRRAGRGTGLTTAELSYLPERRQAFDNLAKRCGHSGVKAVAASLNQAEKYGTPLGQALRVAAQENREMRMQEAEKKAAALPAKLTVPMIIFFLPCLFVVILGTRRHAGHAHVASLNGESVTRRRAASASAPAPYRPRIADRGSGSLPRRKLLITKSAMPVAKISAFSAVKLCSASAT